MTIIMSEGDERQESIREQESEDEAEKMCVVVHPRQQAKKE
ncbi:unnamed protein product [Acanthoscelides obtectus]|uniref:Uncharacterized protein n=1 Tax=Acanthoscelides obtectus TaxID=200917 RepID=A0A9P0KC06_ACAOB|nr:unnamed protein product [Acanthoscelides obtectus]CAK1668817.1 hypothetical protein AOBTE_LOCUS26623 [Acanthoscelides obtectus]